MTGNVMSVRRETRAVHEAAARLDAHTGSCLVCGGSVNSPCRTRCELSAVLKGALFDASFDWSVAHLVPRDSEPDDYVRDGAKLTRGDAAELAAKLSAAAPGVPFSVWRDGPGSRRLGCYLNGRFNVGHDADELKGA